MISRETQASAQAFHMFLIAIFSLSRIANKTSQNFFKQKQLFCAYFLFFYLVFILPKAEAQIVPDATLPVNSIVTPQGNTNLIEGGTEAGRNLFHSFQEFSIPTGGEAVFNNHVNVQNIFSRVTGASISNIDGLIRANGSANLFLLNPNGIIFGQNAQLNIGGSFVASTASGVRFADGTFWSAKNPEAQPLLTISVPIGLQFGLNAGTIVNQSQTPAADGFIFSGLSVQPGRTLALLGSGVTLEDGGLVARQGRIEVGSVGDSSLVSLNPIQQGYALGYEGIQNFQDIQLSSQNLDAAIYGDNVQLWGRQVNLTNSPDSAGISQIVYDSNLSVNASQLVEIGGKSGLIPSRLNPELGGDLTIATARLILRDEAIVSASSGANLTVNASESVELIGNSGNNNSSSLSVYNLGSGDGGILAIATRQLTVQDGARIVTNTSSSGDAANLIVRATDSVKLSGEGGIFALTEPNSTGNGGNLTIETQRLEGTSVAVQSFGQGLAGRLTINTVEPLPPLQIQIVPDLSLPINSTVRPGLNTTIIEGGTQVGSNLFHSFDQFSIPTGSAAYFNHALDVQNIITRVTGQSISNINGVIQANGIANLFLLNPNGIVFGLNASLNMGGSFLASTASSLNFADGTQFSATNPQATPSLTIAIPTSLQFGNNPGTIVNQSRGNNQNNGLRVRPEESLALAGGNVILDGGNLTATGGGIELGGVAAAGTVGLNFDGNNLRLSFPDNIALADVSLTNQANVDVRSLLNSEASPYIRVRGRRISLSEGSNISSFTDKAGEAVAINASESIRLENGSIIEIRRSGRVDGRGGDLTLNALELVELKDSRLRNDRNNGGSISIQTRRLVLRGERFPSWISTISLDREGGDININASESVDLIGFTWITSQTFGVARNSQNLPIVGEAGNITINTGRLLIQPLNRTGIIRTSSTGGVNLDEPIEQIGRAGNLTINASEAVVLDGRGQLLTSTDTKGAAGDLTIQTRNLIVRNGGSIIAGTNSDGAGGVLTINATDSVELSGRSANNRFVSELGAGSGFVSSDGSILAGNGRAGDINIQTGRLIVRNDARVTVSSLGNAQAGNLRLEADLIELESGGALRANTRGGGGNIEVGTPALILRRGSNITTNAEGSNIAGGNIILNAGVVTALENSDISANSEEFRGGAVTINTQGIFGTGFRTQGNDATSDITATGADSSLSGSVTINTPEVEPSSGLIELPQNLVDVSTLIADRCALGQESSFVVTGRGGIPPSPEEPLGGGFFIVDLLSFDTAQVGRGAGVQMSREEDTEIVEATGWIINEKGQVVLVASRPRTNPYPLRLQRVNCFNGFSD